MRVAAAKAWRIVSAPAVCLAVGSCLLGCDGGSPSELTAQQGFLRDRAGRAVILRGVNLSSAQRRPPYIDDKVAADWARLRDGWGLNAVRYVLTWAAVEPARGQYDDAYLDRVAERLRWAEAARLHVVLDMHQDVYGEGFGYDGAPRWTCDEARYAAFQPREPWRSGIEDVNVVACTDQFWARADLQERFAAAWRHVAQRLSQSRAVIGFDILNEPQPGTSPPGRFESERLMPSYAQVVAAVRKEAPGWLAFVEPAARPKVESGVAGEGGLPTPPFAGVVYAPHLLSPAVSSIGFDEARRAALRSEMARLSAEAAGLRAPLWIGSYGGPGSAAGAGAVDYLDAQYAAAGAVAAGSMYWDYGADAGDGLLDERGTERAAVVDTLSRPYPERVAGEPIGWDYDVPRETFTLRYRPAADGVTELSVPDRRYPNGYQVDCGGCAYERRPGALWLLTPPPGDPATVVLQAR